MMRHFGYFMTESTGHLSEYLPERWQGRVWLSGFTGSMGTLVVTVDANIASNRVTEPRLDSEQSTAIFDEKIAGKQIVTSEAPEPAAGGQIIDLVDAEMHRSRRFGRPMCVAYSPAASVPPPRPWARSSRRGCGAMRRARRRGQWATARAGRR